MRDVNTTELKLFNLYGMKHDSKRYLNFGYNCLMTKKCVFASVLAVVFSVPGVFGLGIGKHESIHFFQGLYNGCHNKRYLWLHKFQWSINLHPTKRNSKQNC